MIKRKWKDGEVAEFLNKWLRICILLQRKKNDDVLYFKFNELIRKIFRYQTTLIFQSLGLSYSLPSNCSRIAGSAV